jgi:uncharacterized membrane protein
VVETKTILKELKRVLTADGKAVLTTLVKGNRWSNKYMDTLARSGALVVRTREELLSAFDELDMPVKHQTRGNLAFITYG